MNIKVIKKDNINRWLEFLIKDNLLIAPIQLDGAWKFDTVNDINLIDLNFPSPVKGSLRNYFTPETETLFEFKSTGKEIELIPTQVSDKNSVIFGARACDGAALQYVDAVYSNAGPPDSLYFNKRERTSIIGLYCTDPSWSCFCTEVNNSLNEPINIDIMLTDIGEKYLTEIYTEKGEKLTDFEDFSNAAEADMEMAKTTKDKTLSKLPSFVDHANRSLSYNWDHPIWRKLSFKCLGCGICTFMCPTCHCFDMQECSKGKTGQRFRCWDTCQFEKFTLMGHGHNPRPSKKERTRQRVFHKFKYSQERYGIIGCVGCGRCISACPVNIDIKRVANKLEETDTQL